SHQSNLIRSPRRPRKTNTWPENGFCSKTVWTVALRPVKPRLRSVTPAASQICVPVGSAIIGSVLPAPLGRNLDRPCLRYVPARGPDRYRSRRTASFWIFGARSQVVLGPKL